jgi:cytochrome c-type biogenesis protein CcmH/NrfG
VIERLGAGRWRLRPGPHGRSLGSVSRTRRSSPVRSHPPYKSSRLVASSRLVLGGLAATALVAGGAFVVFRTEGSTAPSPPPLARLGPLAPEIEDLVRQARESVAQDPRDALRWGRFGMVCEANGLVGAARDGYATAAAIHGSEAKWWFHLAAVEARLGKVDEAVRDVRRVIELNPAYAPAFWRLGLWLLDENQIEGAERAFDRATEIDASDRAGWIGLARVYLQRGEAARAAGLLERLVASGAGDPYTLQLLGTAYRRLGRVDEAASALGVG